MARVLIRTYETVCEGISQQRSVSKEACSESYCMCSINTNCINGFYADETHKSDLICYSIPQQDRQERQRFIKDRTQNS